MAIPAKRRSPGGTVELDPITVLYPHIDQTRNPLPRTWCPDSKCEHLGLSHGEMRVHYKGPGTGKNHKDAGSVRTTCPIPPGVGIYYYEVRVVSKGRDGYMGVGLSLGNVNLNRLPGWDKDSYGYHGDDGNSFCCSGSGQPYGPQFTTGDIVGCGVNFIERTVFFTKNGINLGAAFSDLPIKDYYPTVGLQTPGETLEANFGLQPFVFDLTDLRMEMRCKIQRDVFSGSINFEETHKLVSTFLIQNGHCRAAEAFSKHTGISIEEEIQSIRNRQEIQNLVLQGLISRAICETNRLYPKLLSKNPRLEFALKCRQLIEMIAGIDPGSNSEDYQIPDSDDSSEENMDSYTENPPCDGMENGNRVYSNGSLRETEVSEPMEVTEGRNSTESHLERIISFGRQLNILCSRLRDPNCEKQLLEIFGLLAYEEPFESPLGYLLEPIERETVCSSLNSAVLESQALSKEPPLQVLLTQTSTCLSEMTARGFPSSAFVDLNSIIE